MVAKTWNKKKEERQIFFNGKAKQNKVGAKERYVFFSGKAKQNEVGGRERLGCPALMLKQKCDNRVTLFLQLYFVSLYRWRKLVSFLLQLHFVLLYHWRKFVFLFLQPFLYSIFLWQQYSLSFCFKRLTSGKGFNLFPILIIQDWHYFYEDYS